MLNSHSSILSESFECSFCLYVSNEDKIVLGERSSSRNSGPQNGCAGVLVLGKSTLELCY